MDRPVTSKARGICRYYTTPRGCFAGDNCKFLHGPNEHLTPYDKAKVCKYYARGHCTRGDRCWFRHDLPKIAADDERIQFSAELCCICLEKPTTYGLLTDCSHVFCLECIRQWRAPEGKSPDVVSSGTIKCCPLCRTPSRFVTPSAHFFPDGSARKKETIDAYKASMARVSCKYFVETSRTGKPCCPFGIDCFYQHINPDGSPHVFCHGAKHFMNVYRRHRFRNANVPSARFDSDDPIEILQHIFDNPLTNLHATLDAIRASLPFTERFAHNNEPVSDLSDDEDAIDNFFGFLEDYLAESDEEATSSSDVSEGDRIQSMTLDPPPEHVSLPVSTTEFLATTRPATPLFLFSESQPANPSSRFSTAMSTHRQTYIIDISDDDEEDEEEEEEEKEEEIFDSHSLDAAPIESPVSVASTTPRSPLDQQPTSQPVAHLQTDMSPSRTQREQDVDPPFLTDGRGRVVWSSTRSTSAREGRQRHSRTGSTSRIACPSPSSTILANTRAHAWEAQGADAKAGGAEENGDVN